MKATALIINNLITSTVRSSRENLKPWPTVLNSLPLGHYGKASVWDFPVMTSLSVFKKLIKLADYWSLNPGWKRHKARNLQPKYTFILENQCIITPVKTFKLNYEIELALIFNENIMNFYNGPRNLFGKLSNTEQTEAAENSLASIR